MALSPRTRLWAWLLGTFGTSSPMSTLRYTEDPGLWTHPCSGDGCSKAGGRIRMRMASTTRSRLRELKSLLKCGDKFVLGWRVLKNFEFVSEQALFICWRYVWAFYFMAGNTQRRSQKQSWRPGVEIQGMDGYHSFFWHGAFCISLPVRQRKDGLH